MTRADGRCTYDPPDCSKGADDPYLSGKMRKERHKREDGAFDYCKTEDEVVAAQHALSWVGGQTLRQTLPEWILNPEGSGPFVPSS